VHRAVKIEWEKTNYSDMARSQITFSNLFIMGDPFNVCFIFSW